MINFNEMPQHALLNIKKRFYKKGQRIIEAGDSNSTFYMVYSGVCASMKSSLEGKYAFIDKYHHGRFFGELEIFDSQKISSEVVALEDCELWCLEKDQLLQWMQLDFVFTLQIIKDLSITLRKYSENSLKQQLYSVRQRVAQVILSYYDAGILFSLDKNTLSMLAKTPIRSVNRALMELKNFGVISIQNKEISISDIERLKQISMIY